MQFLQKYIVPLGLLLSVSLLIIAGLNYPGGSPKDINSTGYSWTENYISNLLEYKAMNGIDNPARPFGVLGVVLMGITSGFAFFRFSQKVGIKGYSVVIKYMGLSLIFIYALVTIPALHDLMVRISIVPTLLVFFYITVLLLKTRLNVLKILALAFLLSFYGATFMYFSRTGLDYLPILQKLIHVFQIVFIIGLEYFTSKEDFKHLK